MAGVFISYRREDAPGHAGRIFDRVRARFGADVVFMDVTAIDAGADFVEAIEQAVGACDVLLAIIGPQWAGATDNAGRRRLENPTDFIRLEIAGALKRNVRVVPVLVDGAPLPAAADLPDDLQPLLRRNAVELRDARWDADIEQLIASLERIVKPREEPLRIDRRPPGPRRLRMFAAFAVVALSIGAAALFGPRGCATVPSGTTAAKPSTGVALPAAATPPPAVATAQPAAAATATPRETKPPARASRGSGPTETVPPPSAPKAPVPDVVGRSLPEARDALRRAGVDVARVLYRDDRTKAIDLVVVQTDVRTGANSPPAVALTAVARAAVVISHRPEDADLARGLLGALISSRATAGLAMRTVETLAVWSDAVAPVRYSDDALASTAADIAKDATEWLQRTEPGRPSLTASLYPKVSSRTVAIVLPERSSTTSPLAPLPDVRGLTLGDASRKLSAAGVTAFDYKWSVDGSRKPFEVFGQSELRARAGGRMVGLEVGAKGTVWVYHLESDAPIAERLRRDLQSHLNLYGIVVRLERSSAVRPEMVGKVASDAALSREAGTIATFASNWLANELGRTIRIERVADKVGPRRLTFGLPSLR